MLRARYGSAFFDTIHLASDDARVRRETARFPEFRWVYVGLTAEEEALLPSSGQLLEKQLGGESRPGSKRSSPANATAAVPSKGEFLVHSMTAELMLLSQARLLIGTNSHVSHAAFLLAWARHGVLPPAIWLDGEDPPILNSLHFRFDVGTTCCATRDSPVACCCSGSSNLSKAVDMATKRNCGLRPDQS